MLELAGSYLPPPPWTFHLPNNGDLVLNVAERLTLSGLDCGRSFCLRCNSSLSDEESDELLEESDDEEVELVELVEDWVDLPFHDFTFLCFLFLWTFLQYKFRFLAHSCPREFRSKESCRVLYFHVMQLQAICMLHLLTVLHWQSIVKELFFLKLHL